jgi:alkylation response protein AidB-like acyl-CoA dehydrogenase
MSELLTITTEYLKTRRQFGRALSDNQALQHRVVDMHIALHETRVLVVDVIRGFDDRLVGDRKAAVSAVKAHTGAAARLIGQEAVQLHGAIGTTEDCIVGHYFKRLTAIDLLFGNRTWQLRQFSKARLQQGPGR